MEKIKITYDGKEYEYEAGITYLEIAKQLDFEHFKDIVLCEVNGKFVELFKTADRDGEIKFITTYDKNGRRTYQRSLIFLMERALFDIDPDADARVMFSFAGQALHPPSTPTPSS